MIMRAKKGQAAVIIIMAVVIFALVGAVIYMGVNLSKENKSSSESPNTEKNTDATSYPSTPTEVLIKFIDAAKVNDTDNAKIYTSNRAISNIQSGATALGKSFDEVFKTLILSISVNTWNSISQSSIVEEITGDVANINFQSASGVTQAFTGYYGFVKEDGKWKFDSIKINVS